MIITTHEPACFGALKPISSRKGQPGVTSEIVSVVESYFLSISQFELDPENCIEVPESIV